MDGMKVLGPEEKDKILQQTQSYEASVYFKFINTDVFKTTALQGTSKRTLICKRPPDLPITFSNKPVTMNFVLDSEVYFLATIVSIDQRMIYFNIDTDIFHLARRKNRRLKFPAEYEANLMVKRLDGQMSFLRAIVLDLSTGGARLALNTDVPLIHIGQSVEGSLRIGERQPMDLIGEVRYHRLHVRKEHKQVFGVQFQNTGASTGVRLQNILMELQRELFLRILE